jgi:hypothetical protein
MKRAQVGGSEGVGQGLTDLIWLWSGWENQNTHPLINQPQRDAAPKIVSLLQGCSARR